jgi:glycosyltransferase involved in cell wall biosynthesis
MNILYVAERINAEDGSSVHCRAFVDNALKLGHKVCTYPAIQPIVYRHQHQIPQADKNFWYYLRKINYSLVRRYLLRSNPYISELLTCIEGLIGGFVQSFRLKRIIKSSSTDVIIYRNRLFNFAPYWAAREHKLKVVTEINSLKSIETPLSITKAQPTVLTRAAERYAINHSSVVVCVSQNLKKTIKKISPEIDVGVVPNGVDTAKFDPSRFKKDEAKRAMGLTRKFVIGYTGSYQIWHGLDQTLNVAALLRKQSPDYHFLLIGYGVGFKLMEENIHAMGLADMFTQIKTLPHDQIPFHLSAFDCALMTYPILEEFYFSPLKMFEYMAMEVPVLSTAIGQIAEVIEHKKTGLLVTSQNPEDYVSTLLQNKSALPEIGRQGRLLMAQQYSWLKNAERVIAEATLAEK